MLKMHFFPIVAVFSIPPLNMTSSLVFLYHFNAFDQLSGGSIIEIYRMIFGALRAASASSILV